jgi:hypothetical protein
MTDQRKKTITLSATKGRQSLIFIQLFDNNKISPDWEMRAMERRSSIPSAVPWLMSKKTVLKFADSLVEIWIKKGPFVHGDEYHEAFYYNRSSTITKIKDTRATGWTPPAPFTNTEASSFWSIARAPWCMPE